MKSVTEVFSFIRRLLDTEGSMIHCRNCQLNWQIERERERERERKTKALREKRSLVPREISRF